MTVEADEEAGTVRMFVKKDVVEEVDNPCTEMSLQMAREKLPHAQLGDVIRIDKQSCYKQKTQPSNRRAQRVQYQVIHRGCPIGKQLVDFNEQGHTQPQADGSAWAAPSTPKQGNQNAQRYKHYKISDNLDHASHHIIRGHNLRDIMERNQ